MTKITLIIHCICTDGSDGEKHMYMHEVYKCICTLRLAHCRSHMHLYSILSISIHSLMMVYMHIVHIYMYMYMYISVHVPSWNSTRLSL